MDTRNNTIIESIGIYLPPNSVPTKEILDGCVNQIRFPLERMTGISTRRVAGNKEFSIDLAINAITECFSKSVHGPEDIDLLICCNISRYDAVSQISMEPCTSVKIKHIFDFPKAVVFDITNACAGMFTGIYLVDSMIKSGAIQCGMVVSGEHITHLAETAQKEIENFMDSRLACLTLGDAGAAVILEEGTNSEKGFQEIDMQTLGDYSHFCIAKPTDQEHGGMIMYTDSVNLTNAAVSSGAQHSISVLQKAKWPYESFQHLIMHQTSRLTMDSARRQINRLLKGRICHDGNTINNLKERGNTASTSHFIALADHIKRNNIHSGDKVLFSISASGLTMGTVLYVLDDLPDRLKQGSPIHKNVQDLSENTSINPATQKVRIESYGTISIVAERKSDTLEKLVEAARSCLNRSSYDINQIGMLIYCGVYRTDYILEPAYATLLAGKLKMNSTSFNQEGSKTLAFDIFNGSVGFLNACYVAKEMILSGKVKTVMVVAAETENNASSFPDELLGIRGAASAIIIDGNPSISSGFLDFTFSYTAALNNYNTYWTPRNGKSYLHIMKDHDIEILYINSIRDTVTEFLKEKSLQPGDIDIIFPPQISSEFILRLSQVLEFPLEKFIDAAENGGDLFSSSIVYAMDFAHENQQVKQGDLALIIAVGSGIQSGCSLYNF